MSKIKKVIILGLFINSQYSLKQLIINVLIYIYKNLIYKKINTVINIFYLESFREVDPGHIRTTKIFYSYSNFNCNKYIIFTIIIQFIRYAKITV